MTLFRIELGRLLRNPFVWLAAVVALALQLSAAWAWAPDMSVEPIRLAGSELLIAAAVLLAANLAASRDQRNGMLEGLAALPRRVDDRTRAVALAGIATGVVVASLVTVAYLAVRYAQGSVAGTLDPFEALAGIAATAAAAAFGVALARWLPSLIAGVVVVFGLGLLIQLHRTHGGFGDWLLPLDLRFRADWPDRPAGPHLVYLVAATVVLVGVALLRHRVRRLRVGAVAAALVVLAGAAAVTADRATDVQATTLAGEPGAVSEVLRSQMEARFSGPDARRCQTRDAVRYCAFPGYAAWIPLWAGAVRPVIAALPPAARRRVPVVDQISGSWLRPGELEHLRTPVTGMVWRRDRSYRTMLAGDVVRRALGRTSPRCTDARGRAWTVVGLWLLGQQGEVPPSAPVAVDLAGDTTTGSVGRSVPSPLGATYGPAEIHYAQRLLRSPGARARIWASWDTLMRSSLDRALPLLGLARDVPVEQPRGSACA